jgi:hypothetical protein
MKRDYRKEYDEYHAKPEQKKRRASLNAARNKLAKTGRVRKGDGKEVDHKDMNPRNNRRSNLKVVPKVVNRKKQPKRNVRKA